MNSATPSIQKSGRVCARIAPVISVASGAPKPVGTRTDDQIGNGKFCGTTRPEDRDQGGVPAAAGEAAGDRANEFSLSQGQLAIVPEIARGLSSKEIGVRLGLSEAAVNRRLEVIFRKLQVNSRVALVMKFYAVNLGAGGISASGNSPLSQQRRPRAKLKS